MKKTYIEPKNTVVKLSSGTMIAASADPDQVFNTEKNAVVNTGHVEMESRETISSQDAWEEW